ncbi:protein of unknown function [Lentzea fradiae]|uniref:DUF4360 domain-containing protein n=1 Tax=Lentzea fradiae TaxID=200378 RepID=A0A1G7RCM7_9PSEU|nr:DUF4360 domain-containing protein [Lentzea fradiae]SDG08528.1 protein of unknown function [Lentzea fradiae]
MLTTLAAAALAMSTIVFPPGGAPLDTPPPDHITIDVVTINGSGCPAGTAAVAVSPDNKAFTVTYSEFMAQVGPQALPTDFRKNCQLNLRVNVPSGFTYGISSTDYRGFAHLEAGATALERANYYFQGMSQTEYRQHNYAGPFSDDWQATDTNDIAAIVYHPCGEKRNFNINTELRVNAGTSDRTKTSFIAMDSTDGSIETTYHFAWLVCPPPR